MTRGRWFLALCIIILAFGCTDKLSPAGPVADTPENRKAAAKLYLEAVPPQELLRNITGNMTQRLPEPTRTLFLKALDDNEIIKSTYSIIEKALVKYFTPAELNAMTAFFGSAAGKSARSKFTPYMRDIVPQISTEVKKVYAKVQEQAKKEQPQEGPPAPDKPKPAPSTPEEAKPAKPETTQPKPVEAKPAEPETPQPPPEKPEARQPSSEHPKPEPPKSEHPKPEQSQPEQPQSEKPEPEPAKPEESKNN